MGCVVNSWVWCWVMWVRMLVGVWFWVLFEVWLWFLRLLLWFLCWDGDYDFFIGLFVCILWVGCCRWLGWRGRSLLVGFVLLDCVSWVCWVCNWLDDRENVFLLLFLRGVMRCLKWMVVDWDLDWYLMVDWLLVWCLVGLDRFCWVFCGSGDVVMWCWCWGYKRRSL